MSNATVSRLGQVNGAGDALALFLKIFSGEVMTEFEQRNVMMGRHRVRTISSGKSASFAAVGNASASYHVAGEDILDSGNSYLNEIKTNERLINVDDLLIAPVFVSNLDEAMNHYDVRAPYAQELGRALAYKFDRNVLQTAIIASRAAATITGGPTGGSVGGSAAVLTNTGDALVDAILAAAQKLDENNVPEDGRFVILRPAQYWALLKSDKAINRDFDGAGSISQGKIWSIGGVEIVKSNHIPSTDLGGETAGTRNDYNAVFTNTVGVVMSEQAVGTVKLLDIATETEYSVAHQGNLLVSKYAMGHGILRPECAIEITSA